MFHYVYKTTYIPTGRWYVGIRSCRCWPTDDPYLGSGKALASLPREELSKRVLMIVETREEMRQSRTGRRHDDETRARIAEGMRASWEIRDCNQSRTVSERFSK